MARFQSIASFVLAALLMVAGAEAEDDRSYGYVRTLEGSATVSRADGTESEALLINYPLQVGDLLRTDGYTALELVLADYNIVRVGAQATLELRELGFSADSDDRRTALVLVEGELQIEVSEFALGDELPRIETSNATVFIHEPGTYSVDFDSWGVTRLVVRRGYAEVTTERGSAIARAEEKILVEGLSAPAVSVLVAGSRSSLEEWGDGMTYRAELAAVDDAIAPALAYSASALEGSGEWVEVEGTSAWRPRVEVSWRPFTRGTWATTPSGLTWVGYEPWGWVTGHYGYWSQHASWGWIWYPGYVYSPAWVDWHWGEGRVGWAPTGNHGGHETARRSGRPAVPRGVRAGATRPPDPADSAAGRGRAWRATPERRKIVVSPLEVARVEALPRGGVMDVDRRGWGRSWRGADDRSDPMVLSGGIRSERQIAPPARRVVDGVVSRSTRGGSDRNATTRPTRSRARGGGHGGESKRSTRSSDRSHSSGGSTARRSPDRGGGRSGSSTAKARSSRRSKPDG